MIIPKPAKLAGGLRITQGQSIHKLFTRLRYVEIDFDVDILGKRSRPSHTMVKTKTYPRWWIDGERYWAMVSTRLATTRRGFSLSFKLTTAYSLLTLLVTGSLALGMYTQLRRVQRQVIRDRAQDLVSLAQPQIDSDFHSLLVTPMDAESSYYDILQDRLATIYQTSDDILRLYTLRERPDGSLSLVLDYGADQSAPIGREFTPQTPLLTEGLDAIAAPVVETALRPGTSGTTVLHGYAPIIDSLGRQEGVLAIELNASEILASERQARNLALFAFMVVLPLALGGGHWLTRRLTAPINRLVAGVERVTAGDWSQPVKVSSRDEMGLLATRFNEMRDRLQTAFETLEAKVTERTQQLSQTNEELQTALVHLQRTQSQLIQAEKMLGLGQMVAGIAHEINNPVGFIHTNLYHLETYSHDLLTLLAHYQQTYPQPDATLAEMLTDYDLEFVGEDLPKILRSMRVGTERIREIVLALRNFSRLDEAELKEVDVREGLDSTLLMVQHRLHGENGRPCIELQKNYQDIRKIECYPGQLNQVFLNLLNNAIDALQDSRTPHPKITVTVTPVGDSIQVAIADNGPGMPPEIQQQVFNPFFTTKPIGHGTGLGLAVSYSIIVEQHDGEITVQSTAGQGTEFTVEIPVKHQLLAAHRPHKN